MAQLFNRFKDVSGLGCCDATVRPRSPQEGPERPHGRPSRRVLLHIFVFVSVPGIVHHAMGPAMGPCVLMVCVLGTTLLHPRAAKHGDGLAASSSGHVRTRRSLSPQLFAGFEWLRAACLRFPVVGAEDTVSPADHMPAINGVPGAADVPSGLEYSLRAVDYIDCGTFDDYAG